MPEKDYRNRIIEWAVNNPGGLWKDTPGAAAARKWLRINAPDDLRSLYYNEDDSIRRNIDRRFIQDDVKEEEFSGSVSSAIDNAGRKIFGALDTATSIVPGPVGGINWLGHFGADLATGRIGKAAFDLGVAGALGVGTKAAGRIADKVRRSFRFGDDLVDLSKLGSYVDPGNSINLTPNGAITSVSEPKSAQIGRLIDRARHGIDAPLQVNQTDLFGEQLVLPEEFAASMRLDEFKRAYPNGVDFWYRGLDPLDGAIHGTDWRDVHTKYPALFGGDRKMASSYVSNAVSPDGDPGLLTLVTPKGLIVDAGDMRGAHWEWLTSDKPGLDSWNKKLKALYGKAKQFADAGDSKSYEAVWKDIDDSRIEMQKLLGVEVPGLDGRFIKTDQIAAAVGQQSKPMGVLLRNIDDGPVANEVIWNYKSLSPKAVHPEQTYTFDLHDGRYLSDGGILNQYSTGGRFFLAPEPSGNVLGTLLRIPTMSDIAAPVIESSPVPSAIPTERVTPMVEESSVPYRQEGNPAAPILIPGMVQVDPFDMSGVTPSLDLAEMKMRQRYAESGFRDNLTSKAGAKGRYQIMPITLQEYTERTGKTGDLMDATFNEGIRDWYMDTRLPQFSVMRRGNPTDLVREYRRYAAYNMGPGALNKALTKAEKDGVDIDNTTDWVSYLPKETRDYVSFIVGGQDVADSSKTRLLYEAAKRLRGVKMAGGGTIHIAKNKKGTFTAAAKKHGKSVQAFASQVLAHKENYSPAMIKKANFARNSRKWKRSDGGDLNIPEGISDELILQTIRKIRSEGIG